MTDAYAPTPDPTTQAFARLVSVLAEEIMFALSGAGGSSKDALDGVIKRRAEVHTAAVQGQDVATMVTGFDAWFIDMARTMAPIAPPSWMPMADVVKEKVTLEGGGRGLRSLFSAKPSDKDVQRVKRLGTLATRVLRAVYAADGPIDAEEARMLSALIGSFGLPEADATPLYTEPPVPIEQLDVFGDIDAAVTKGLVRGAWLAAAWDAIDPREEAVVRLLAQKLGLGSDVEAMRNEVVEKVDARRTAGLAVVDGVRFILADRVPGSGVALAAHAGTLLLPRRYREEALSQVAHGAPVTLAKRHHNMSQDERSAVLGVAWAAALHDDPSMGRRALLRSRFDRFAADIGDEGARVRPHVEAAMDEVLAIIASGVR